MCGLIRYFLPGVVKDTADNYKIEYASDAEYEEYLSSARILPITR